MKCDICGKRDATINVQKVWIKWKYDAKTGDYSKTFDTLFDVEEPTGNENLHLCNECFGKWRYGEI